LELDLEQNKVSPLRLILDRCRYLGPHDLTEIHFLSDLSEPALVRAVQFGHAAIPMTVLRFALLFLLLAGVASSEPVSLFDGTSLDGWEGDTEKVWRIRDGVIVGGSLEGNPQNEFLATRKRYGNFRLRLEYKLVGTEGFVNGGVQFWSKRIEDPANEMIGFQADIGAGYSGCLYDESRRRKMLANADKELVKGIEKEGDWNTYEIAAEGSQIEISVNSRRTTVWVERNKEIPLEGFVALQIHGGCKAEISFRNITIEELPDSEVPRDAEVFSRFGEGQPQVPLSTFKDGKLVIDDNETIVFVGQENFVRDQKVGMLEAQLAQGWADREPRFRSMAWEADTVYTQWRELNFGSWSRQLETTGATMVIAQFGQMEALDGIHRLTEFKTAYHRLLDEFASSTRRIILFSPMPFEKPVASHAPDLTRRNSDVAAYAEAVRDIARERGGVFVDLIKPFAHRDSDAQRLTSDGIHLNHYGLRVIAGEVARQLGAKPEYTGQLLLQQDIIEKNRLWFDCWRPANWSFVYGDRVSSMFGKGLGEGPSLKEAFESRRPLIEKLDARVHALAKGGKAEPRDYLDNSPREPSPKAMTTEEQLATFTLADGYEVNLFAAESDDIVKPIQFSWDERGHLYVACSPTYPQTEAIRRPADYIVVLEDTDGDGRADKTSRFAESLTMIQGVEPGPDGLYVCDFDQILYLRDSDGDGRADSREVLFSGFGIGDTHQLVNSISHGPDGSLWFTQGLHAMSRVETAWGIARLDRAAVWRLRPRTQRLEGFFGGGMAGANCWGVAFDDYGQVFHKSGDRPDGYWSVPGMVRGGSFIGSGSPTNSNQSYNNSPEQYHSVGPLFKSPVKTTSLDIIGTKALPDDIQGCALIGGYMGSVVELHRLHDEGSGFRSTQLPKLMQSSNNAFRPVDVNVGPDGAIYLADWYNPIIGHYQTSYADPRRDRSHGRIWRISSKSHQPVKQPNLAGMSNTELLSQLKSPERWTRGQAKRLLFYRPSQEVLNAADAWVAALSLDEPNHDQLLLEVTGVCQAHEAARPQLLDQLLSSKDFRVRAYGTRVAGEWAHLLESPLHHLHQSARDAHPRVRLEAVVAATYVPAPASIRVATAILDLPRDPFLNYALHQSARALQPLWAPVLAKGELNIDSPVQTSYLIDLAASEPQPLSVGETVYYKACLACHQPEGKGLAGVYPSLAESDWVTGDTSRLIKTVLHGLSGPIEINGRKFESTAPIPMPRFVGLSDEEISEVLTFLRSSFGNDAGSITAEEVKTVRSANQSRQKPWTASEF
jgi:putative membrane-bound dehydrogenase-like protein